MDPVPNEIRQIARAHSQMPGALLPSLHAIQKKFGYLPAETVATVADVLNLSRAEVHGVIGFYHLFRTTPPGERTLYVCRSEACQSMGAKALEDHAKRKLGVNYHQTSADGRVSLEPIYCLGNCACAPAVMIDDTLYGRVTTEQLERLIG